MVPTRPKTCFSTAWSSSPLSVIRRSRTGPTLFLRTRRSGVRSLKRSTPIAWSGHLDKGQRWYKDGAFFVRDYPGFIDELDARAADPGRADLSLKHGHVVDVGLPGALPAGCSCDCFDCKKEACKCAIAEGFCDSLPAHFPDRLRAAVSK